MQNLISIRRRGWSVRISNLPQQGFFLCLLCVFDVFITHTCRIIGPLFTARRYASVVYAVVVCLSIRLSSRVSHARIVSKRLNVDSRITQTTPYDSPWTLRKSPTGARQIDDFRPIFRYIFCSDGAR